MSIEAQLSLRQAVLLVSRTGHSNLPVYRGKRMVGILNNRRIVRALGAAVSRGQSADAFLARYERLADILMDCRKLSGFCYTQLYDVEQEENGLYYYDRHDKLSEEQKARMRAIHSRR